jgi:hypothetical protein
MHFEPNPSWYWTYSPERRRILIRIFDGQQSMSFLTSYGLSDLFSRDVTGFEDTPFNVDDASFYFYVLQSVSDLPYTPMEKLQLALNAVTIKKFYCKGLKSIENLKKFSLLRRMPCICEVFSVQDESNTEPGDVLVINSYDKSSVCIVLATGLMACGKKFRFLDVAVINNENFIPLYKMNLMLKEQVGL